MLLLAKSKQVLVELANQFGTNKPELKHLALVRGVPRADQFEVDARLASHPTIPGMIWVDSRAGKRSQTRILVAEHFSGYALLHCFPVTGRTHQIRVHARHAGLPLVGDAFYGGKPLLLSRLKSDYRLKPGRTERPLLARVALHAEQLTLPHPVTGQMLTITAPCPKDLRVALKYLREFGATGVSTRLVSP